MDIEYLLLLQEFRNGVGSFLAPFMMWISDFVISFWPLAIMCMIYWSIDRKAGKRFLLGFNLGILANGLLKLTFCIYRPWIRDARVVPYGNSMVSATGYSFPSGHSTWATSIFGHIGYWLNKNKQKLLTKPSRMILELRTPNVQESYLKNLLGNTFAWMIKPYSLALIFNYGEILDVRNDLVQET